MQKNYGVAKEEITMALESKNSVSSIYESGYNSDEDGLSMIEKISSDIDEQNMITNRVAITQLLENLKEKEKEVILLRYYRGKTQMEVAKIMGTSQVQISRIEKRALEEMKKRLSEDAMAYNSWNTIYLCYIIITLIIVKYINILQYKER